jgi:hypothetical protein
LTGFSIATQGVTFPFPGTDTEVLGVWVVPAILDFSDLEDMFIETELSRTLVGFVAGVGVDVDWRDILKL